MYKCRICGEEFEKIPHISNHYKNFHKEKKEFHCHKCNKIFTSKSSLVIHEKWCDGKGSGLDKRKEKSGNKNLTCDKCGHKFKNRQGLGKHRKTCDGIPVPKKRRRSLYGRGGLLRGKTYEEIYGAERAKELKEKLSRSIDGKKSWDNMTEAKKKLHSKRARKNILKRYEEGWDPKAGRAPKYKYKDFTVDGSWELEYCKWADENNIYYERNYDRFDYFFENQWRKYKPDFKIGDNLYVEVKGYQTDKDLAKWNYFKHNLIILKRSQIERIKKRTFKEEDLNKYIWSE